LTWLQAVGLSKRRRSISEGSDWARRMRSCMCWDSSLVACHRPVREEEEGEEEEEEEGLVVRRCC
jgi:hypothetical protein